MTKPIKPSEVADSKKHNFPPEVFQAFNECIAEKYNCGRAQVTQDDVITRMCGLMNIERRTIFDRGWLNVEDVYRNQGWKVEYDKPGYNESYGAFFVFKEK